MPTEGRVTFDAPSNARLCLRAILFTFECVCSAYANSGLTTFVHCFFFVFSAEIHRLSVLYVKTISIISFCWSAKIYRLNAPSYMVHINDPQFINPILLCVWKRPRDRYCERCNSREYATSEDPIQTKRYRLEKEFIRIS